MQLVKPLLLLSAASLLWTTTAAAQLPATGIVESHRPDEVTVDIFSGHGPLGGSDSEISVLAGPSTGIPHPLTAGDFAAAKAGPGAAILTSSPWVTQALPSMPLAKFIAPDLASGLGTSQASGLFAVEFEVPAVSIFTARMDFTFMVDDHIGKFGASGVYINGQVVDGTGAYYSGQEIKTFQNTHVARQLKPGTNTLYVYTENPTTFGGLIFHARIRVNQVAPDESQLALPAYLGVNPGATKGFTTSPEAAACGTQSDRWYYFVPPSSGTLTATVDWNGGASYTPALGVFSGSSGALVPEGCATATGPAANAVWTGPVQAGVPLLFSLGGTSGALGDTGKYRFLLDIAPNVPGLVYPGNGHLYMLTPSQMDVPAARNWAALQGGYLVAINDAAENAWVASKMSASDKVWLGLSDELVEGTFVWDSGEPFTYNNWNAGEPNDAAVCNGEDYVETIGGGLWNDLSSGPNPCNSGIHFGLVEIPASGLASTSDLGGACGLGAQEPFLYTEPHVIGGSADMAVLNAPPGELMVLFSSDPNPTPTPIGSCVDHLDPLTTTLISPFQANEYGSIGFSVATPNDPLLQGVLINWQVQFPLLTTGVQYSNAVQTKLGN